MSSAQRTRTTDVSPSAARLTESLRDIGYDFQTAVADIVDNSIAAGAHTVDVDVVFDGNDSYVTVADDGAGMSANGVVEAVRFGSRREYEVGQLGRYGLGLKTASLSQARRLTVASRRSTARSVSRRTLDLDTIAEWDQWLVTEEPKDPVMTAAYDRLRDTGGTVVVWQKLDRIVPPERADSGHTRRKVEGLTSKLKAHLSMVFHRFIEGDSQRYGRVSITVNGEKLQPWDPFASDEASQVELTPLTTELRHGTSLGTVRLRRFILPPRDEFSSPGAFESLGGPLKWNRQQGLYVYRADRLVQWGGWAGLRAIDEHTKLARAALDFDTNLDSLFNINVAKMRVSVPTELRQTVDGPLKELCMLAGAAYRRGGETRRSTRPEPLSADLGAVGLALQVAAMELGSTRHLDEVLSLVADRDPEMARALRLARAR